MKKAMQAVVAVGLVVVGYGLGRAQTAPLKSGVMTSAQAAVEDSGAWGAFRKSFGGPSLASADVLAGIGDIKAGAENHPPHTHADEEFLYLAEGTGTWTLGDSADSRRRPAIRSTPSRTCSTGSGTRPTSPRSSSLSSGGASEGRSYPGCPGYPGCSGYPSCSVSANPGNLRNPGNPGNCEFSYCCERFT